MTPGGEGHNELVNDSSLTLIRPSAVAV